MGLVGWGISAKKGDHWIVPVSKSSTRAEHFERSADARLALHSLQHHFVCVHAAPVQYCGLTCSSTAVSDKVSARLHPPRTFTRRASCGDDTEHTPNSCSYVVDAHRDRAAEVFTIITLYKVRRCGVVFHRAPFSH